MATLKQSTTYTRSFLLIQTADHITGATSSTASMVVKLSKGGSGAFSTGSGSIGEMGSGWYNYALSTTDTNTLGDLAWHITATSADPTDFSDQVTANILGDTLPANLTQVNGASATTTIAQLGVNVVTNGDKTGYSLSQSFPTNFSSLAITGGGAVTVGTNSDKTGYSLTQTFPTNFSTMSINSSGFVTYANAAPPTTSSIASAVLTTTMTEAYSNKGDGITLANFAYETGQLLTEFAIAGTTLSVKKRDQSTTATTFTLNDATTPTALTRAS